MLKSLKDKAMSGAMKVMQSDKARKMMSSAEFQKVMMKAFETGFRVKQDLDSAKKTVARSLNVATGDDLADMKRTIDRLERKVRDLKSENESLRDEMHGAQDE